MLSHSRVIGDRNDADAYYKQNVKRAKALARNYAERLSSLGFNEGKILDAGCGPGVYAIEIAKSFPKAKVIGIDLSEPVLDIARKIAEKEEVFDRVTFEKRDVQNLPFADNSFNAVINNNMLHIVENPVRMLNEINRVLASNGILELADIKRSWIGYIMPEFKTAFTLEEAKDIIKDAKLHEGRFVDGFLWWGFEMIKNTNTRSVL
jgi:ubiquinone/menaquinone biosynthesis C-methylase UbiE